jgi:FMN reductase [NAD(P)H]
MVSRNGELIAACPLLPFTHHRNWRNATNSRSGEDYLMPDSVSLIKEALLKRFGERLEIDPDLTGLDEIARIAAHRVHRRYLARDIPPDLVRLLCACALSAPSKSDLQQADIVVLRDRSKIDVIAKLLPEMPWVRETPVFLVFLANGSRLPKISLMRGKPFPNDHLDLLFNATVDAAIVMTTFFRAAEAVGLGCCPISVIRDHAAAISEMLALPEKVIPVAGMCLGWPAEEGRITPRLSLEITVHAERFAEDDLSAAIDAYDHRRAATRPYLAQREPERFGRENFYGWSEDKARQYAVPQRADFGAFVRSKNFRLD